MYSEEKVGDYAYYADSPVHISQYENEFKELLKLFRVLRPQKVLELGTHYGGTLYQWLQHTYPGDTVVTVDDYQLNWKMYNEWNDGRNLHYFKGKTQDEEIIESVRALGPYDFIFIDADHSYDGVKADWEVYGEMIRPTDPCLVAFHDIKPHPNTEVNKLWSEIKDHYFHWEFVEDENQEGCGIGVILIVGNR